MRKLPQPRSPIRPLLPSRTRACGLRPSGACANWRRCIGPTRRCTDRSGSRTCSRRSPMWPWTSCTPTSRRCWSGMRDTSGWWLVRRVASARRAWPRCHNSPATPGQGIASEVARTGKAVAVSDTWADPRVARRITDPEGIRSMLQVPITVEDQVFGVFGVNYLEPRRFTGQEERLLSALAQRAALAIENARLFEQAQGWRRWRSASGWRASCTTRSRRRCSASRSAHAPRARCSTATRPRSASRSICAAPGRGRAWPRCAR